MSRDILSGFGPDSPSNQQPRATNGGNMPVKPIPYDPPKRTFDYIGDSKSPGLPMALTTVAVERRGNTDGLPDRPRPGRDLARVG